MGERRNRTAEVRGSNPLSSTKGLRASCAGLRWSAFTIDQPLNAAFAWFFRDRASGRIVIGQWPNLPLWLFGLAQAVAWIAGEANAIGRWADIASWIALAVWAGDEVLRGVNPWRRCLGGAVLLGMAVRLIA